MIDLLGPDWRLDRVETVLFDKDGTFVDSHHYWGEIIRRRSAALADQLGISGSVTPLLERSMGLETATGRLLPDGPIALRPREVVIQHVLDCLAGAGAGSDAPTISRIFANVHRAFLEVLPEHVRLLPGFVDLVTAMREGGAKIAVVTTDARENTELTLRVLRIASLFDLVIGREDSPEAKETGVPARIAMERLGSVSATTVCVGDAPMDVLMARNANCRAVAVSTGQVPLYNLKALTPYTIHSLRGVSVVRHEQA